MFLRAELPIARRSQQASCSPQPEGAGASEAASSDDSPEDRLVYPQFACPFPAIEQEALVTKRAGATPIAVAVGSDAELLGACSGASDSGIELVLTQDGAAAIDLVVILRPQFVVVTSSLSDAEAARLTTVAASQQTRVVWVATGTSRGEVAGLVHRAALAARGRSEVVSNQARSARPFAVQGDPT